MEKIWEPVDRVLSNIGRVVLLRPGFSSLVLLSAIGITFWENGVIGFPSEEIAPTEFASIEPVEQLVPSEIQETVIPKELALSQAPTVTPKVEPTPEKTISIKLPEPAPASEILQWKTVKVKSGDTLSSILKRQRIGVKTAIEISKLKAAKPLANLKLGTEIALLLDKDTTLTQLAYPMGDKKTLLVKQGSKGYKAEQMNKHVSLVMVDVKSQPKLATAPVTVPSDSAPTVAKTEAVSKTEKTEVKPETPTKLATKSTKEETSATKKTTDSSMRYVAGEISRSLYADARKAGLSVKQANQLSQIFATRGLTKGLRKGDEFSVLHEKSSEGKSGNILFAQITKKGEVFQAIRFTDPKGKTAYYNQDGKSFLPAISRAPLKYTRVSSHYSKGRRHPLLHITRAHQGVDYSAPSGTPIKAAGDGVIVDRGYQSGYGNMITIEHDDKYKTLYAHMSRFGKSAKKGTTVKEGDIIGYVGQTGIATGPHLHYEIHVNNVPKDPLTVAISGASIPKAYRKQFLAQAKTLLAQVKLNKAVKLAKSEKNKQPASRG